MMSLAIRGEVVGSARDSAAIQSLSEIIEDDLTSQNISPRQYGAAITFKNHVFNQWSHMRYAGASSGRYDITQGNTGTKIKYVIYIDKLLWTIASITVLFALVLFFLSRESILKNFEILLAIDLCLFFPNYILLKLRTEWFVWRTLKSTVGQNR